LVTATVPSFAVAIAPLASVKLLPRFTVPPRSGAMRAVAVLPEMSTVATLEVPFSVPPVQVKSSRTVMSSPEEG